MWKIIKINLFVSLFFIFFVEIILISLNFFFDGGPMYKHFNITENELITYKKKI